ncbi:MAG: FecR domain-containing protein [Woeseiaceae bacterium]
MSNIDQGARARSDEDLEQLLSRASPRPMPSESDEVAVRDAVRAEWQVVSGRQRSRRRIAGFAIAATVLVAVFSIFSVFRPPVADVVQVATIQKEFGSIYLLAETSELRETEELSRVLAGQTIVTGGEAGMALAWGAGGSLRMDANSRVRFVDTSSIRLESGRVYFDSRPSPLMAGISSGGAPDLLIVSEHGEVTHVGTQFMTQVDDRELTVSVREGQVIVDGQYQKYLASSGEQVTMAGRGQPIVLSISATAAAWDWVSRTSPVTDVEGKSLHEFLLWVCRETGLEYRYEGGAEETARHEAFLHGKVDAEPLEALKSRLATAALTSRIAEGVIIVSDQ